MQRYPSAVITTGGYLPAQYVIHTVGPVWSDGASGEKETLANAYKNSLKLATETGLQTIAFPAISTGVYGFPKELAAPIVYSSIQEYIGHNSLPREVYLVFFSASDMDLFITALQ